MINFIPLIEKFILKKKEVLILFLLFIMINTFFFVYGFIFYKNWRCGYPGVECVILIDDEKYCIINNNKLLCK